MAHVENQLLCNDPEASPKLYLRYIDDIFAIFDNDQSCTKFLEKLNTQHPNIKFTLEQAKSTIPFLDVEIKINLDRFDTWTWRKPSNTGLLLNFNAFCPKIWKKGLILCLLNRAKITCSTDCSVSRLALHQAAMPNIFLSFFTFFLLVCFRLLCVILVFTM